MAQLDPLSSGYGFFHGCYQGTFTEEGSGSEVAYVVVNTIQFLWIIGLRASVSPCLLARGYPQFPTI